MVRWRPALGLVILPVLFFVLLVQPSPAFQGDDAPASEPAATAAIPPPPAAEEVGEPAIIATETVTGVVGPGPEIDWSSIELIQEPERAPSGPDMGIPMPQESAPPPAAAAPATDYVTHVVARGDNLSRIAMQYGVALDLLKSINQLTSQDLIHVGQLLMIPPRTTTAPAALESGSGGTYLVQPGDSAYKIARRFGTTVQAIAAANGLADPSALEVGQVLTIPSGDGVPPAPAQPAATPVPHPETATPVLHLEGDTYVVQSGDSLYKIARRFGTTVAALAAANNLANPSALEVGQVIRLVKGESTPVPVAIATVVPTAVPQPSTGSDAGAGGSSYTVQRGDSLYKIARRFGSTVQALATANNLANPAALQVGQVIQIVSAENAPANTATPAPVVTTEPQLGDGNVYVVRPGDSLYKIALRFSTTVQAVAAANNLGNVNALRIGMQLVIPEGTAAPDPTEASPSQPSSFIWPVQGRLLQYFRSGHPALDIEASIGTEIVAAAAGVVEFVGWNSAGYGNLTILDHGNGVRTLYAHQSTFLVESGQQVEQGQSIGKSGSTGWSTWPHLHLEIIVNAQRVNPCGQLPGGC